MAVEEKMNSGNQPFVSIGLPVYNGTKYIREALDSLLMQEHRNFELIISDNASNDGTTEICEEYARQDSRIRFSRNRTNLGARKNFQIVLNRANGPYFMWAAHDDLWDPTYISKCVAKLEKDPSATLAFANTGIINEHGNLTTVIDRGIDTYSLDRFSRLHVTLLTLDVSHSYALMRREKLQQAKFFNIWCPDTVLLMQLAILGSFRKVPETLYFARRGPRPSLRATWESINPANRRARLFFPGTQLLLALLTAVYRSPVKNWQKPILAVDAIYCLNVRKQFVFRDDLRQLLSLFSRPTS